MTAAELAAHVAEMKADVKEALVVAQRSDQRSLANQEEIVKLRIFQGRATVVFTILAAAGTGMVTVIAKFVYDIASKVLGT